MKRVGTTVRSQTLRELLVSASVALGSAPQARWIVAHAAGLSTGDLVGRLDITAPSVVADAVHQMVNRCLAGEPLQYVLGTWAFRTLEISVDRRVLIPRPETEQVVSAAIDELAAQSARVTAGITVVAVDLGTGSGVIALSLAAEFEPRGPALEVWATDVAAGALALLGHNLAELAARRPEAAHRVRVAQGSWFDALPGDLAGQVRLVVSNPPYVSKAEWESLDPVVREHEPAGALVPGPTGLEAIEVLLVEAPRWLAPGGSLVVELAPGQARPVAMRAEQLGYEGPEIRNDLAGRSRMLVARWPGG
jgi:release factor glutamine methyltransferase